MPVIKTALIHIFLSQNITAILCYVFPEWSPPPNVVSEVFTFFRFWFYSKHVKSHFVHLSKKRNSLEVSLQLFRVSWNG
jgi:hypothetical protein